MAIISIRWKHVFQQPAPVSGDNGRRFTASVSIGYVAPAELSGNGAGIGTMACILSRLY